MESIDKITIKGFKSIKSLEDFELKDINVFVGGNGAGKSNVLSIFKIVNELINGNLNPYLYKHGGASDFLYNGRKETSTIEFSSHFGERGYRFTLTPTIKDTFVIENESRYFNGGLNNGWWSLGSNIDGDSLLTKEALGNGRDQDYSYPVYAAISSWQIYHFHDTGINSPMRHYEIIQDNKELRKDASNIAPYLLNLRNSNPKSYNEIISSIKLVTPFFNDFLLEPVTRGQKEEVNLSWLQSGSNYPMQPYHFSDGTLRFICLATALLQPNPPSAIIIDEPELGLHPAAIALLAELIQDASSRTQIIIATQSPALIDYFNIDDIVVVNRKNGESTFERLKENDFKSWLDDYSLGELWSKNVIIGGPSYE